MIGKKIAHYEVVAMLGQGGMGEVYRARDPRTGRDVAIKSLNARVASDPERLARFRREARTLASLNHPNIAGLYGAEEQDGRSYLVMELVEGLDLAHRIAQGPIPLEDALEIALQMARGIEEAHEKGIVHRDLKPANVRVTPEGAVKILDFGLARAVEGTSVESEGDPTLSPTITAALTSPGIVLGTAAYMSPEQARGRAIDRRADLWAFGVIVWEMLTGTRLFRGETISDTIAAVLRAEPDWDALPEGTPVGVRRLLERCLERDPRERLRDIGEARIQLERWKSDPSTLDESFGTPGPAVQGARRASWLPWSVSFVAVLMAVWFASRGGPRPVAVDDVVVEIRLEDDVSMSRSGFAALDLSPDGRYLMWSTAKGIHLRRFDSLRSQFIPTRTVSTGAAFSPDGRTIAYDDGAVIYRRAVEGGASVEVCRVQATRGLCWADDHRLVISPSYAGGLILVDILDGSTRELTTLGESERSHRWPAPVRGHDEILFMSQSIGQDYQESKIEAVSLVDGSRRVLHEGGAFPRWSPTGHLLYVRHNTLLAAPYQPGAERIEDLAMPVLENLFTLVGDQEVDDGSAQFGFDDQGTLVYRTSEDISSPRSHLAWLDLETGAISTFGEPDEYEIIGFDRSGHRLAVRCGSGRDNEIVVLELDSGSEITLTSGRNSRFVGSWSADASDVYWSEPDSVGRSFTILSAPGDGSLAPVQISRWEQTTFVDSATPDGRWLLVSYYTAATDFDVGLVDLRSERPEIEPFVAEPSIQGFSRISPDGTLVLHGTGNGGYEEFFVRRFPDLGARWRVGERHDRIPIVREMHWGSLGDRIYEIGDSGLIEYSVQVAEGGVRIGAGKTLAGVEDLARSSGTGVLVRENNWDAAVHPDGRRMLVLVPESSDAAAASAGLVLRTNWFAQLRAVGRMPR